MILHKMHYIHSESNSHWDTWTTAILRFGRKFRYIAVKFLLSLPFNIEIKSYSQFFPSYKYTVLYLLSLSKNLPPFFPPIPYKQIGTKQILSYSISRKYWHLTFMHLSSSQCGLTNSTHIRTEFNPLAEEYVTQKYGVYIFFFFWGGGRGLLLIRKCIIQHFKIKHIVSWEPERRYCSSKMFHWESEGRYCCTKSMAIAPFWFSMEHLWSAIAPFWLSADDILSLILTVIWKHLIFKPEH